MKILLIGDIHGRIFHLLKIVQKITAKEEIDFVVQVGDFSYFTSIDQLDESTVRFAQDDPSELHTIDYLNMDASLTSFCKNSDLDKQLIHFIRGNHECHELLQDYIDVSSIETDPLGCLRYIPDGTIIDKGGIKMGFLGGVESTKESRINEDRIDSLRGIDILITHDGPYGISQGFKGQLQGSKLMSQILSKIQPKYHFYGHYHIVNGPWKIGRTLSYGLSTMVLPNRRNPELDINPGSFAIFDTDSQEYYLLDTTKYKELKRNLSIDQLIQF